MYSIYEAIEKVCGEMLLAGSKPDSVRLCQPDADRLTKEVAEVTKHRLDSGKYLVKIDNAFATLRVFIDQAIPQGKFIVMREIPRS